VILLIVVLLSAIAVADLEIFRGGLTKTPAQLQLKTEKKVITSSLNHFSHTETSLAYTIAPKPTHCP